MKSILTLILLTLTGCAGYASLSAPGNFLPPEHHKILQASALCCKTFQQMSFVKLAPGEELQADLTPESPVYEFEDGRSFFSAFELPQGKNRPLLIKTYPVNMLFNRTGHVLIPALIFLDAQRLPIGKHKPEYTARAPAIIGDSWAEAMVAAPENARFVVLLDSRSPIGMSWRDRAHPTGYLPVRSGPTGKVRLSVSSDR